MTFALTRTVFEETLRLPVTDERASAIVTAVHGAVGTLSIEEKFNLLLENFEEFETELLNGALHRSLFQSGEWSSSIGELHRLNRRLVNLLATARLYVDQIPHSLSQLFGSGSQIGDEFRDLKSREYDAHLGYRVMEALRNYMQHRSLPIHVIAHQMSRRDHPTGSLSEHVVTAEIHPAEYREDGKFKGDVLTELGALGEKVDLPPLVREYVASLARVHSELRTRLTPFEQVWDGVIEQCGSEFQAAGATDLTGLALIKLTGDHTYDVVVHTSPGPIVRRRELERRNRFVEHYERVLIASRATA
jgi:hypothetical protein